MRAYTDKVPLLDHDTRSLLLLQHEATQKEYEAIWEVTQQTMYS